MVIEQIPKGIGVYLWSSGRWNRRIQHILLVITTGCGFLLFAPMLPYQFQLLVLQDTEGLGGIAWAGFSGIILLSFLFGRHFCGFLCPIGALQEIASHAPFPKFRLTFMAHASAMRWIIFSIFVGAGVLFCRLICPYGALVSVAAMASRFKIRQRETCIECGKCEKACPTNEARRHDLKGECYLCGRCIEACPIPGTLEYHRK
jgi:polyferredoxin